MQTPDIHASSLDYHLPEDRIAKYSLMERDASRLLVYNRGQISHEQFRNLPEILGQLYHLVVNETKVISARMFGVTERGDRIEIFLLEPGDEGTLPGNALQQKGRSNWKVMVGSRKKWKENIPVYLETPDEISVRAVWKDRDANIITLEWEPEEWPLADIVSKAGLLPLPPYLNRRPNPRDKDSYNTRYSTKEGAVAAPTAGLHFSETVIQRLENSGCQFTRLALHVGAGTFLPMKDGRLEEHIMHAETYEVSLQALKSLATSDLPLLPVGTTSLRTLESLYWRGISLITSGEDLPFLDQNYPYSFNAWPETTFKEAINALLGFTQEKGWQDVTGRTALFIRPGYKVQSCKALITNFHQPKSTLLALVHSLIGEDWRRMYDEALDKGYRFLSFGDSSLLLF